MITEEQSALLAELLKKGYTIITALYVDTDGYKEFLDYRIVAKIFKTTNPDDLKDHLEYSGSFEYCVLDYWWYVDTRGYYFTLDHLELGWIKVYARIDWLNLSKVAGLSGIGHLLGGRTLPDKPIDLVYWNEVLDNAYYRAGNEKLKNMITEEQSVLLEQLLKKGYTIIIGLYVYDGKVPGPELDEHFKITNISKNGKYWAGYQIVTKILKLTNDDIKGDLSNAYLDCSDLGHWYFLNSAGYVIPLEDLELGWIKVYIRFDWLNRLSHLMETEYFIKNPELTTLTQFNKDLDNAYDEAGN